MPFGCITDPALDRRAAGEIHRCGGVDRVAILLDQSRRLFGARGVQVAADDDGALAGEQPSGHSAHAAADTRQQDDFAFQAPTGHVSFSAHRRVYGGHASTRTDGLRGVGGAVVQFVHGSVP